MKHIDTRFLFTQDFGVSKIIYGIGDQDRRESERNRNDGIETRKSMSIAKHVGVGELARTYPPGNWSRWWYVEFAVEEIEKLGGKCMIERRDFHSQRIVGRHET